MAQLHWRWWGHAARSQGATSELLQFRSRRDLGQGRMITKANSLGHTTRTQLKCRETAIWSFWQEKGSEWQDAAQQREQWRNYEEDYANDPGISMEHHMEKNLNELG